MDTIVLAPIKKGSTSVIRHITLGDSTVTTGAGIAGLVFNTASLTAYYIRPGDASATAITLATATIGTWTSGGFKEVAATNCKGTYELGIPNACLATGADECSIEIRGATGLRDTLIKIPLIAVDPQTATNFGLSCLPTAAPGAANGLVACLSNAATTFATLTSTGAFTCGSLIATAAISTGGNFNVGANIAVSGSLGVGTDFDIGGRMQISDGFIVLPPATVDRPGFDISGNGAGAAMKLTSGPTGKGIEVASNDNALELISAASNGILLSGTTSFGIAVLGGVQFANGLTVANGLVIDTINVTNDVELLGAFNMQDVLIQAGLQATGIAITPGGVAVASGVSVTGNITATSASNDFRLGATERVNIATAVWNFLTSAITLAGSIGKALVQTITGAGGTANFTITVTDGTNPLQSVTFSLYDGVTLIARGTTDVNGNFTASAPLGTYSVALFKTNYTFAGATRTVTGNFTGTLNTAMAMTVLTPIVPPVDPLLQTIYGTLYGLDGPAINQNVTFELVPVDNARPLTVDGNVVAFSKITVQTDGLGAFSVDLTQTILMDDPAFYHIVCPAAEIDIEGVVLGAAPVNIADL